MVVGVIGCHHDESNRIKHSSVISELPVVEVLRTLHTHHLQLRVWQVQRNSFAALSSMSFTGTDQRDHRPLGARKRKVIGGVCTTSYELLYKLQSFAR